MHSSSLRVRCCFMCCNKREREILLHVVAVANLCNCERANIKNSQRSKLYFSSCNIFLAKSNQKNKDHKDQRKRESFEFQNNMTLLIIWRNLRQRVQQSKECKYLSNRVKKRESRTRELKTRVS